MAQINFTKDEYAILCEIADRFGTAPAWMMHDWVMERAGIELYALKAAKGKIGSWDGRGSSPTIPRSNTIEDPET